jgi:bifunctional non-homologous end joining protein LigD
MGLKTYRKKRQFDRTPEPRGKRNGSAAGLRFVVQKHDASRLHYDFRLELDGVLKSWAVPKGPSLNPADKRLAVMVEDHPFDYRTFEGTIPAGNYGAGTVMVWDEGFYHAAQSATRLETEKEIQAGLARGHISFVLEGKKLNGEFSLVRIKGGKGNDWLLIKKHDESATGADITASDRSAVSGRDLDEIARGAKARKAVAARRSARNGRNSKALSPQSKVSARVGKVKPMLATLIDEPFNRENWLFEIKWDGYRAIAEIDDRGVALYSRNHKSFARQFSPLVKSLQSLRPPGHQAVLDGEIVVLDEQGKSSFQLLQNYAKTGTGPLRYCVFDLLELDGRNLRAKPLTERKALLSEILADQPDVILSEHVEERGTAFFQAAVEQGLEGLIAKDGRSPYREGHRGLEWLKIKTHSRQEAVIGGFTDPRGSRRALGAILLGVYRGTELVYIGHTGGGFSATALKEMRQRLDPLATKSCPFETKPKANAPVHWVKPELVCEVSFQEWTGDGRMRQPIFLGLRPDKSPRDVRREVGGRPAKEGPRNERNGHATRSAVPARRGPEVALSNLDKVFWPDEGYTKGDVVDYYREMGPLILKYLRDRPESLHRHPNGIEGKSFFQKDVGRMRPPAYVETVSIADKSGKQDTEYLVCQNPETLLYLANLGCIELNPWNSRLGSLDKPDYLVIDLDPEDAPFIRVVETANVVRKVLERAGAEGACKTSGKRGLHVFVPLGARYDYEQAKQFAELVALKVNRLLPATTSVTRSPAKRQGRVYPDFLQNRRGQTLAAPYCIRPYPGACVSTPLAWREVKKGLDPSSFTIKTVGRRIQKVGDLWTPVLGAGIDLAKCLERMAE